MKELKTTNKVISALLALILLASCLGLNAFATVYEYDQAWLNYMNSIDNTLPLLTPGADESELYINWHSAKTVTAPKVKFAKDALMTVDAVEFDAVIVPECENETQQVNRVIVTGLEPNTTYYYTYTKDSGSYSAPAEYKTYSADSFHIMFTSDVQVCTEPERSHPVAHDAYVWNNTLNAAFNNSGVDISFIVSAGDQTVKGLGSQWVGFLAPEQLRHTAVAPIIGNHDIKSPDYKYYTYYPNAYDMAYPSAIGNENWYRYGDVLFVNFDSTSGSEVDHYAVAKQAVEANPDAKWRVAVMHHDIYGATDSAVKSEINVLFRNLLCPIYDEFGFDVVLTGHSHSYSRSVQMNKDGIVMNTRGMSKVENPEGTVYISACCGGDLYDEYDNDRYEWTAYRYEQKENVYTILGFDDDTFTCKTYEVEGNALVDEYTIVKTEQKDIGDGSGLDTDAWFGIVKALASIYTFFDAVVKMFEGWFAK